MMFVYAVLVWLVVSCCVAGWMGYQWWHAERHKPSPVDRNGGSTTDRYTTVCVHLPIPPQSVLLLTMMERWSLNLDLDPG